MLAAPSMSPTHATVVIWMLPPLDRVSVLVAVMPVPALIPQVIPMLLVVRAIVPLTAKLNVWTAIVLAASLKPEFVKLAIAAFTLIVTVHAATHDAASMVTEFAAVGTVQPLAPPEESAHRAVSLQFPVPPTQNRPAPTQPAGSLICIVSPAAHPAASDNVTTVPPGAWVSM